MKINYYDYSCPFLEKITDKEKASIYVFSNFESKLKSEKKQNNNFLEKSNMFFSIKEFKNKVATTQKIIIREEKLTSIFYKLLTDREKKVLQVNNYFDVIEISSKFYNFFSEIKSYHPDKNLSDLRKLINKNVDLKKWQIEKIDIFFDIRDRYNNYMEEKGFVDQNTVFNKENFTDFFISDYSNIVFINKFNFTTKEKELINFLEDKKYSVELNLQVNKDDFSEKELQLKNVTLPEKIKTDLKLFSVKEELLQLINTILKFNKDNYKEKIDIFDCDFDSKNYNKYLNKKLIEVDKNRSFTETKIYRYLEYLRNLLNTADRNKGSLHLEVGEVLKAINSEFFSNYYEISKSDKDKLIFLKNNNYVYLTENLLKKEGLVSGIKIFDDIKNMENISSFDEFICFLDNINLKKLNDEFIKNNYEVFYSAIHEIKALSRMNIIDNWKNYFNNLGKGFFKFFLNYLRYKEVKEFDKKNKTLFKISSFETAPELSRENLSILNASSDNLGQKENDFILTEKQKENLGLNIFEYKNILEKYYFMRHIFSSKRAYVFSINNLEENISESAYMEELAMKYNLEIKETEFNNENFSKIIGQIFKNNSESLYQFAERNIPADFKDENLPMEKTDFSELSSLSYYRLKRIKDCQYRYFLEHIIGLEKTDFTVEKQLNVMIFGSLVHEIFAKINENFKNNFELYNKNIDNITEEILDKYDLKINNYFEKYYNNVLFEKVKESAHFFLKEIKKMTNNKIEDIFVELGNREWIKKSDLVNELNIIYENEFSKFYLNGRVDLLVKNESNNIIIDFKTGGSETEQLDFYELMLFPENITKEIKKMIYNVMEEKFNISFKNKNKFKADIKEELEKFMEEKNYSRIYKSRCNNCPYYDICRVVLK